LRRRLGFAKRTMKCGTSFAAARWDEVRNFFRCRPLGSKPASLAWQRGIRHHQVAVLQEMMLAAYKVLRGSSSSDFSAFIGLSFDTSDGTGGSQTDQEVASVGGAAFF